MDDNPYSSPAIVEQNASRPNSRPNSFTWGKLELLWDACFLFGYVWFLGAATMYGALRLSIALRQRGMEPNLSYDAKGYISFFSWSLVAVIVGVALICRKWRTLFEPWPDWKVAGKRLLMSSLIVAPIWVVYLLVFTGGYHRWIPWEAEWVPISIGACLGILHGWLCKRGR